MAKGNIYFFTTGWTVSDNGVTRPNYPIKKKYKQIVETKLPKFPDSFQLVDNTMYWFPYSGISPLDTDYIQYTTGDEYGWTDDALTRPREIVAPAPNFNKSSDYLPNDRIVYAGAVYEATPYTFNWSDYSSDQAKNPYRSNRIRKWKKIADTATDWTQYWYHPKAKRFYTLPDIKVIQDLPDPLEPDNTKWDAFLGDAKDLTLTNFTFAQIQLLVKQGETQTTAKELIDLEDRRVLDAISGDAILADQNIKSTRDEQKEVAKTTAVPDDLKRQTQFHVSTIISAKNDVTTNVPGSGFDTQSINAQQPMMRQYVTREDGSVSVTPIEFTFPYKPNNINYSNIGSNYAEIDRVNNTPIIDFKNYKLMKISFEFLVGASQDLSQSCDEELRVLRTMARNPDPVTFMNFDAIFKTRLGADSQTGGSGVLFAIIDMSISSIQRTQPSGTGTASTGEINRATVSMTIQELPIDRRVGLRFPRLKPTGCTGPCNPPPEKDPDELCRQLFSAGGYVGPSYRSKDGCRKGFRPGTGGGGSLVGATAR